MAQSSWGRSSVEPGFANHISKKGQMLSDIYKLSYHTFEEGEGKSDKPVIWAKAEDLLAAISDAREIVGPSFVKVMADGGQGFLKICLTVLPDNYNPDLDRATTEKDLDLLTDDMANIYSPKKRSTYKESGGIGKYKLTSVKRLIILALVPDCKETHHNMKILFDLTCLNDISFLFVADYKLLQICLGYQTATSTYPCPFCLVHIATSVDATGDEL